MTSEEPATPMEDEGEDIVCPHCIEPIGQFDHFCSHCDRPVTTHASTDPLGQVYASGHAYRNATSGRPKLIVVLGIWLIFGPQVLLLMFFAYYISYYTLNSIIVHEFGPYSYTQNVSDGWILQILKLLLMLALLVLYVAILWQTTRNYRKYTRNTLADDEA